MAQEEDYSKGYIKGYQDGLEEAWEEIIKLSTKGYTSRELQIMAKSKKSMLYQQVQQKLEELERVLGKKLGMVETARPPAHLQVELRPGWSYVLNEVRPDRSFALFSGLLSKGSKGLCISRTHPDVLRQKYGFDADIVWLTKTETVPAKGASAAEFVSPNNLARLASHVRDFLSGTKNGAIIIEGLEYLTTQNDFRSVLKFIQLINEQVVLDKGYLIMPVDGATMDAREFSLIEREMSQVA
jgi:hypothetical protein